MDECRHRAVTTALDLATTLVAEEELKRLSLDLTPQQTAKRICEALRELGELQSGIIPNYNSEWVALLYCLWYQPIQINIAHTLTLRLLKNSEFTLESRKRLYVYDFGCGALAMNFGLALSIADEMNEGLGISQIAVESVDKSCVMKRIGRRIWMRFINEIANKAKYPDLEPLRKASQEMMRLRVPGLDKQRSTQVIWLTALHVAYGQNAEEVKNSLDEYIAVNRPDMVLVSVNGKPSIARHAYCTRDFAYRPASGDLGEGDLELQGELECMTGLRSSMYDELVYDNLSVDDLGFTWRFLKKYATTWTGAAKPGYGTKYTIWTGESGDDSFF